MNNPPTTFALIGLGHIGKRHAEMIVRQDNAELVAIADIKEKSALSLDEFDVPFFNSLDAMLQSGIPIDVINIATPNGLHAQMALQCLEAGKHIVIEKPMALTKHEAEEVMHKALEMNRYVFAVMQNRYSPPSRWIKDIVSNGILGKIYMVQVNCYWNRDDRYYKKGNWHGTKDLDGGTLFTQFSHFIDMLWWLFGDIKNISARFFDFNHQQLTQFEDSGFVQFDFVNGGSGCLNYSTSVFDANMESSITIIAENGSVRVGGQYMNRVEYCHIKDYNMPEINTDTPVNNYGSYQGSAANHGYVIQNIVDVLHHNKKIDTTAEDGMQVVDIIERIYALK
ncbi:MAG: Gfo/Idh/MocA family oxidoreductase [Chitinophagales bacterium]